jgi:HAD superfamily hydrolase (TIGR01509 family)
MLSALIFDFDGLILDTEYPEYVAWEAVYRSFGLSLPIAVWAENIGRGATTVHRTPYEDLEIQLGRPVDADAIRATRRPHFAELMRDETTRPGVRELLAEAKARGVRRAVASSSPRSWVRGYLEQLGIAGEFDALCCGDEVARAKPDPELYHAALSALNVPARHAVALEDSPNGIAAARAADIFCVAVPNTLTRHTALDAANARAESLADLTLDDLTALLTANR